MAAGATELHLPHRELELEIRIRRLVDGQTTGGPMGPVAERRVPGGAVDGQPTSASSSSRLRRPTMEGAPAPTGSRQPATASYTNTTTRVKMTMSNSSVHGAAVGVGAAVVAVPTYSLDPHADFHRSMEEIVVARRQRLH
ncbi:hypothetical protein E2562_002289 [Oryza meyeriana var. granulata]|uniref:Uncharacterized protein n=1 Tax=Oryza meyeriana var. granulata TaxID=110450 RepID=A0A6G1BI20_9ORYZ|nr:hypothetical protein E2562_002289 [Oryza meyeriana var. granulata]